jgi:hypothetical protein
VAGGLRAPDFEQRTPSADLTLGIASQHNLQKIGGGYW